ncbi:MAG: ATP-dependent acyl-CoA ligase [Sphingomonadales bacterium]|nr:ATP-dependent acyl-CoA ligase [Sphingomonadales bacterium]MBU3993178.1 AMP-binding protein [Alphaproteobacteria bacterium]
MTRPQHNFGYAYDQMTVATILADKAARNGDRTFLTFLPDGRTFTYADLDTITNRYANGLKALGIGRGAHVAVWMANSPEMIFSIFALGKLGAVAVPLNTAVRGQLLTYYLTHADISAIIADADLIDRLPECAADLPDVRHLIVHGEFADAAPLPGAETSSLAAAAAGSPEAPGVAVKASDLAYLMFTSGTTGPSKANMLAQSTAWSWGMSTSNSYGYRSDDRTHICLPLFHAAAMQCQTYATIMADAQVCLTTKFSLSNYWDEVRQSGATIIALLGSMANWVWNQPPAAGDRDNDVRICNVTPMPRFGRAMEERFGLRVASSYSLTDYAMSTIFTPHDPVSKFGSAGRPRGGMEVRVVGEDDQPLPPGEVGEIALRSENPGGTSLGYYKRPEATLEAWRNLWFHTGDRGYLDDDGYLWFVDRKKDAIRRRGENISAYEVEQIIDGHDAVVQCAVYAAPSDAEDEVAVSVVLKEGFELSPQEIVEHCARNMAHYMVPRYVEFRAELPVNPSLKVEKFKLREHVAKNLGDFWDRLQDKPA